MNERRRAPRVAAYIHGVVETATGRTNAHVFQLSRYGGLLSTEPGLANDQVAHLHIDVDRSFEEMEQAPDVLTLPIRIVDAFVEEGSFGGDHVRFAFTDETVNHCWPWLDGLCRHYGVAQVES